MLSWHVVLCNGIRAVVSSRLMRYKVASNTPSHLTAIDSQLKQPGVNKHELSHCAKGHISKTTPSQCTLLLWNHSFVSGRCSYLCLFTTASLGVHTSICGIFPPFKRRTPHFEQFITVCSGEGMTLPQPISSGNCFSKKPTYLSIKWQGPCAFL